MMSRGLLIWLQSTKSEPPYNANNTHVGNALITLPFTFLPTDVQGISSAYHDYKNAKISKVECDGRQAVAMEYGPFSQLCWDERNPYVAIHGRKPNHSVCDDRQSSILDRKGVKNKSKVQLQ